MITDSLRVKGLPAGTKALFGGSLIELRDDYSVEAVFVCGKPFEVGKPEPHV